MQQKPVSHSEYPLDFPLVNGHMIQASMDRKNKFISIMYNQMTKTHMSRLQLSTITPTPPKVLKHQCPIYAPSHISVPLKTFYGIERFDFEVKYLPFSVICTDYFLMAITYQHFRCSSVGELCATSLLVFLLCESTLMIHIDPFCL